jgi:chromodomain protein Y
MANALERLVLALSSFPKLLVAAVNGAAVGLGVTLLPLFDIVYANDKAQFSSYYSRLGQVPEACASVLLPMASPVREMLLLGRALSAQELVTLGLVTQSFFPGRLMEETIPRLDSLR